MIHRFSRAEYGFQLLEMGELSAHTYSNAGAGQVVADAVGAAVAGNGHPFPNARFEGKHGYDCGRM
ncbi:MAG: hypothetical protein ACLRRT_08680 [Ruthenibacterium lactatiformans]